MTVFSDMYDFFDNRTLTTPTEETWPGVSSLPDYKPSFPAWKTNQLAQSVKQLDNVGLDLVQVGLSRDNSVKKIHGRKSLTRPKLARNS